ncbi:MAG: phosphopantetheine-binding protein [Sulfurimonas sp.]|nr:phosphopantetheine-binding protein [Sulfurimonas sp.]
MATQKEVYSKIKSVLMDEFEVEEDSISMEANLFTDLELDSLDAIDLMVTLDKELATIENCSRYSLIVNSILVVI